MIGRLSAGLENLDEAARMAGRRLNRGDEIIRGKVIRAGAGDEQPVPSHQGQRELVQLALRGLTLRDILLPLDERRGIDDDDIKALPTLVERL